MPPEYAAEMVPIDPMMGEFRAHYAGFFDPGFGLVRRGAWHQSRLEVRSTRCHSSSNMARPLLGLYMKSRRATNEDLWPKHGSHYQGQGLKLSKHFK